MALDHRHCRRGFIGRRNRNRGKKPKDRHRLMCRDLSGPPVFSTDRAAFFYAKSEIFVLIFFKQISDNSQTRAL